MTSKEQPNPPRKSSADFLFNKLAKYMYIDALALEADKATRMPKTKENSRLTGGMVCIDTKIDAAEKYFELAPATNLLHEHEPMPLDSPGIDKLIEDMLAEDGAIFVEDEHIIGNASHYDGALRAVKIERDTTSYELENKYLGNAHAKIGIKTRSALGIALFSKNPNSRVLVLAKTGYTEVGTGRLFEIGPNGTTREYSLEYNGEREIVGVLNHYRYDDKLTKVVLERPEIIDPIGKDKVDI